MENIKNTANNTNKEQSQIEKDDEVLRELEGKFKIRKKFNSPDRYKQLSEQIPKLIKEKKAVLDIFKQNRTRSFSHSEICKLLPLYAADVEDCLKKLLNVEAILLSNDDLPNTSEEQYKLNPDF